ncbi:MAG: MBL fold metallo-hydrolase [Candidatus Hodarchaeales archaeon]|jgi:glyoxylase-like metal-dependent hydrolase (beta-lactamase superfamily II)
MLLKKEFGPITRFKMARAFFGKPWYFTTAWYYNELLIDTGCVRTAKELLTAVRDLPIQQVVCTHSHEDHFGGAAALKQQRGLSIKAHAKALPIMAEPPPIKLFQRVFWGKAPPVEGEPLSSTLTVNDKHFEIIETPGHSMDHIVLFEPETGFAFTGDLVVGGLDRALRADFNIWGILDSLKAIQGLELQTIFSASGRVIQEPQNVLNERITAIEAQATRVQQEYESGQSVKAIAKRIKREAKEKGHSLAWVEMISRGYMSSENLVRSFLKLSP